MHIVSYPCTSDNSVCLRHSCRQLLGLMWTILSLSIALGRRVRITTRSSINLAECLQGGASVRGCVRRARINSGAPTLASTRGVHQARASTHKLPSRRCVKGVRQAGASTHGGCVNQVRQFAEGAASRCVKLRRVHELGASTR